MKHFGKRSYWIWVLPTAIFQYPLEDFREDFVDSFSWRFLGCKNLLNDHTQVPRRKVQPYRDQRTRTGGAWERPAHPHRVQTRHVSGNSIARSCKKDGSRSLYLFKMDMVQYSVVKLWLQCAPLMCNRIVWPGKYSLVISEWDDPDAVKRI